jgi:hypothetical protein
MTRLCSFLMPTTVYNHHVSARHGGRHRTSVNIHHLHHIAVIDTCPIHQSWKVAQTEHESLRENLIRNLPDRRQQSCQWLDQRPITNRLIKVTETSFFSCDTGFTKTVSVPLTTFEAKGIIIKNGRVWSAPGRGGFYHDSLRG